MGKGYSSSVKKILEIAGTREVIFWGTDALSLYVYEDLAAMGYDIKYFVSEQTESNTILGKEVKPDLELLYEEKENIFIAAFILKNHGIVYQRLTDMGFVFEQDFLLYGFGGYLQKYDAIDSLLGYNRFYGNTLGFQISGAEKSGTYKILALGGSTTDPTMGNSVPWTEYLYQKLRDANIDIMIINGGMAGYSANLEFYKLVRDGLLFEPDMVITYDGLNDVLCLATDSDYPMLTPYAKKVFDYIEKKGDFAPDTLEIRNASSIVHGISQRTKKDTDRWKENIRKIHAICEEFGILHIGFLQPMLTTGNARISERHKMLLEEAVRELPFYQSWIEGMKDFYAGVLPFVNEKPYMTDLTSIFDGKTDIYYDFCHVTDEGNEIIADSICQKILPYIRGEI